MSDRLPGSSFSNPIEYKGYCIHLSGEEHWSVQFCFYPKDKIGFVDYAASVNDCKAQIDKREEK